MNSDQCAGITPLPAANFLDEQGNRHIRIDGSAGGGVCYRGFHIAEKGDFGDHGFLIQGMMVKTGYVVTANGVAIMPGAAWFQTINAAMRAIDDLIASTDMPRDGEHPFWALNRFRRNAEERAPELALLLQKAVDALRQIEGSRGSRHLLGEFSEGLRETLAEAEALLDRIDDNCDMRDRISASQHPDAPSLPLAVGRIGERKGGRFGVGA